MRGQLAYIQRKAVEFGKGEITEQEFIAGKPLYKSLYETFGFLSQPQAAKSSVAHLLYFKIAEGGCRKERAAKLATLVRMRLTLFDVQAQRREAAETRLPRSSNSAIDHPHP